MSYFEDASLVLIPSAQKLSKVYSIKPTDGSGDLTFTRSNDTATRVGPDGLIQKVRTNLFLYSEQFDNAAAWATQGSPIISANASVAPDGTTTADLLYPSVNGSIVAAIQSITSASSVEYTQSVYVKASGKNFVALYTFNGTTGTAMWVNLTTGAITNGVGATVSNRFATNVGNGWWRIGFTDIGNGTTSYMHVYPTDAASSNDVTASGTDGILLWAAQLETGVTTPYIGPTTSAAVSVGPVANLPRLDYLGSSCPRLILEGQRTNSQTYSEDLTQASAWGFGDTTISANATTSPDGYQNADKLVETATTARHELYGKSLAFSGTSSVSFFAKAAERRYLSAFVAGDPSLGGVTFDLQTGTITETSGGTTAKIEDYTNGWYRCSFTTTSTATTTLYLCLRTNGAAPNIETYAGDGTSGLYIWGVQTELAGAYATSYIPTLGASVTRGADAASKTSASALIGQDEGVVFVDFEVTDPADFQPINIYNNNKAADTISTMSIQFNVDTVVANFSLGNGTFDAISLTGGGYGLNQRLKVAFKYKSGQLALYVNGVQKDTDTSTYTAFGTKSEIFLGDPTVYFAYKGGFKLYDYLQFPASLTNAQLAELTTI